MHEESAGGLQCGQGFRGSFHIERDDGIRVEGYRAEGGDGHSAECFFDCAVAVAVADVRVCGCDDSNGIGYSSH